MKFNSNVTPRPNPQWINVIDAKSKSILQVIGDTESLASCVDCHAVYKVKVSEFKPAQYAGRNESETMQFI
jgi:hypothetical protein